MCGDPRKPDMRRVLAIESSCDESSVAVVGDREILSVCTTTQKIHTQFGGVVPELAGRSHLELLSGLTERALADANVNLSDMDLIAVTRGPGLVGSLLVGLNFARGLAQGAALPLRTIHHIEAHLWSAELEREPLPLPFLSLLVSGGHTLLVLVRGMRDYEILGRTLDDAVGEAYDKVGKLIGLEFPAGAALDALAANGDPAKFPLPTPKQDTAFDFSFSGLKTAVLYRRNALREDAGVRPEDIAASFQQAAVASLVYAVESALRLHQCRAISCAGGVAANSLLRARMEHLAQRFEIEFYVPALKYCADNAAMIGYLAAKLNALGVYENCDTVLPRWPLETLPKLLPALD